MDFDHYHVWNSVVLSGRGCAIPTGLHLTLKQPSGYARPFHPAVIAVRPNAYLLLAATALQLTLSTATVSRSTSSRLDRGANAMVA